MCRRSIWTSFRQSSELANAPAPRQVLDGESLVKLFRDPDAQLERDAIGETKNLAKVMPDKAKELHDRLLAWRAEVKAPMPTKNEAPAAPQPKKGRREG